MFPLILILSAAASGPIMLVYAVFKDEWSEYRQSKHNPEVKS